MPLLPGSPGSSGYLRFEELSHAVARYLQANDQSSGVWNSIYAGSSLAELHSQYIIGGNFANSAEGVYQWERSLLYGSSFAGNSSLSGSEFNRFERDLALALAEHGTSASTSIRERMYFFLNSTTLELEYRYTGPSQRLMVAHSAAAIATT